MRNRQVYLFQSNTHNMYIMCKPYLPATANSRESIHLGFVEKACMKTCLNSKIIFS